MKPLPADRHITYQQQYRCCGNSHCHCRHSEQRHGPYWFAFFYDDEKNLKSQYIGKELPEELKRHAQER